MNAKSHLENSRWLFVWPKGALRSSTYCNLKRTGRRN